MRSILIVEAHNGVPPAVTSPSYQVETVATCNEAIERVRCNPLPQLILVETNSTEGDGIEMLDDLRRQYPSIPVIAIPSADGVRHQVNGNGHRGEDHSTNGRRGQMLADEHLEQMVAVDDERVIDAMSDNRFFVAASPRMLQLREQIQQLSKVDVPVLCLGESGTGKEIVARLIHKWSRRKNQPFLKVNCAALPYDLLESELFGYERGAFTGAERMKPGKFEIANGGTILLDEIAEMPTALQAKLLHVLQDHEFTRLGGRVKIKVNVRVLAATNIDVRQAIAAKMFREDLYYRLNTFVLRIPPLREHREDVPVLLRRYMKYYETLHGLAPRAMTREVLERCAKYDWPGNVRELENFARRYLILGEPFPEAGIDGLPSASSPARTTSALSPQLDDLKVQIREMKGEAETEAIRRALEETNWNRKAAASLLKISYKSLLSKLRQYGLSRPAPIRLKTAYENASESAPSRSPRKMAAHAAG